MHCFLQIIYKINTIFLEEAKSKFGNDYDRLARMSIVDEGEKKASFYPSLLLYNVLNFHLSNLASTTNWLGVLCHQVSV